MKRAPDLSAGGNLLLIKPSSLGDIVHALPALETLRRAFPALSIRWVVNTEWEPLLLGNPALDATLPFPRRALRGPRAISGFLRWLGALRRDGPWDLALDLQGLLRSALIAAGSGAPFRLGASDAREGARWFFHQVVAVDSSAHAVHRCLALAAACGAPLPAQPYPVWLPEGEPVTAAGPPLPARYLLLHPYSRGEGKSLSPPLVARLCRQLDALGIPVVLAGLCSPQEAAPAPLPASTRNLLNRTSLLQLLHLLRHSAAVVTVDSGPMHLAAALGRPLLGLHSWSDPRRVGPCRPDATVWKSGRLWTVAELPAVGRDLPPADIGESCLDPIASWAGETWANA